MPEFLEQKLKKEYGAKSDIPYKVMNKMGVMRGNKETMKGKMMEKKHEKDMGKHMADKKKNSSKIARNRLNKGAEKMFFRSRSSK